MPSTLTDVIVCNMALGYCGVSDTIGALGDNTPQARACNLYYARARDRLLRAFDWPFASAYVALSGKVTGSDTDGAGTDAPWVHFWAYAYTYPSDCLAVREFVTTAGRVPAARDAYEVGQHGGAQMIFTDLVDPTIRYTKAITDTSLALLDDDTGEALAWLLAYQMSFRLTVDPELRDGFVQHFRLALAAAQARWGMEQQLDEDVDGDLWRSRE